MKAIIMMMTLFSTVLVAETFTVTLSNFEFTPNNLEIEVGDTVLWTSNGGFHDVVEDNNEFSSGAPSGAFTFQRTFESVEEIFYYCSVHSFAGRNIDIFMNGRINVTSGDDPVEPDFEINQGISGAWYFPETSGSGILLDIRPSDKFIFAAWFTYDVETEEKIGAAEHRWFTASGRYKTGTADGLGLFQTSGGIFDNPQDVTNEQVGTMSFEFSDCNSGMVTYSFDDTELNGEFPIQRVIPGTESLCESLITDDSE